MVSDEWTVEQVETGIIPVWKISGPGNGSFGAPLVLCRTEEAQAVAWAQRHRSTPRTVVEISWWNMRTSAEWVYGAIADILLPAALRVPGVVGAEAGSASQEWILGLYGQLDADGVSRLEDAVRAGFRASPFTFDGADQATVRAVQDRDHRVIEMMSDYRKYVAWTL